MLVWRPIQMNFTSADAAQTEECRLHINNARPQLHADAPIAETASYLIHDAAIQFAYVTRSWSNRETKENRAVTLLRPVTSDWYLRSRFFGLHPISGF